MLSRLWRGHIGASKPPADQSNVGLRGNKVIITTGGGRMIVTDNGTRLRKAKDLTTQAEDHPVEYIHNEIGYNYRLTNIQASMGVAQRTLASWCKAYRKRGKR